jgi:uncharacterized Tic20 family protein
MPAKRDTTFAWLAHLLMIFTWFVGPLVIWLVKKDEDKYAAFHAKQAFCWALAVTVASTICAATCVLIWLVPFISVGNLVYAIIAVIKTNNEETFKYLLVADWFCKREFAEAYPQAAAPATTPPGQQGPSQTPPSGA